MTFEMPDFALVVPEMALLAMACVILVVDLFLTDAERDFTYFLSQAALVVTAGLLVGTHTGEAATTFSGMFVTDTMAVVLKVGVLGMAFATFLYSRRYLRERGIHKGEFYTLGLFGVLGMMVLISAHSLLTVYLGLELLSLCLYSMVASNRESGVASESAMKYFVLGALASGMLLYGLSMVYGTTGTLDIGGVSAAVAQSSGDNLILVFGLSFVVVGVAFKLGAVPFHMWIPDVYHGAPTSVVVYLGTAPKIAAFGMIMRLLVDGLGGLHSEWQSMLIILAVLSLAIGNIVAIAQVNIKRMLAYSTISHVGFILLGVLSGEPEGYGAAMFYTITYAVTAAGAFGMVILLSRKGYEADQLDDFKGLNERSPWFALMMLIMMFSMAGVPPTVGFYAKLMVLRAAVNVELVWLAIVAVVFSIVGAFYYLRVVKLMYFDEPEAEQGGVGADAPAQTLMSVNGLAVLGLGIYPSSLMALCIAATA